MKNMDIIVTSLSHAAIAEQAAEEGAELAQACGKLARKLRRENPTPMDIQEILNNVVTEVADVLVCIEALTESGVITNEAIDSTRLFKTERWAKRILENKKDI